MRPTSTGTSIQKVVTPLRRILKYYYIRDGEVLVRNRRNKSLDEFESVVLYFTGYTGITNIIADGNRPMEERVAPHGRHY